MEMAMEGTFPSSGQVRSAEWPEGDDSNEPIARMAELSTPRECIPACVIVTSTIIVLRALGSVKGLVTLPTVSG
jgi:hypothetical protein